MEKTDLAFSEEEDAVLTSVSPLGVEEVPLAGSHGRILAEDVISKCDVPGFDNSAMDGYAVRSADLRGASKENPVEMEVTGEAPAGAADVMDLRPGGIVRIMTGAPVPNGADAIVRMEDTEPFEGKVRIFVEVAPGVDLRRRGEDIAKGSLALGKGSVLTGARMSLMASVGADRVMVGKRPRVCVVSTGDEIVPPGEELPPGAVRASNVFGLSGEIAAAGGDVVAPRIARDTIGEIASALESAGLESDAVITTGGVSVGKYDHVKAALKEAGGEVVFSRVRMRPGSPFSVGVLNGKPVYMLPGNPAAALLCFEMFVRGALRKMQGAVHTGRPEVSAVLEEGVDKRPGFLHLVRACVTIRMGRFHARPFAGQGSGILSSLAAANGIIMVGPETTAHKAGDEVRVRLCSLEVEAE